MFIGYARVSKADGFQVLDLQIDALKKAGVKPAHIYQDHASGEKEDRPGLTACLKALRKDDVLVVWKLDRLGRDLRHLVNTVQELLDRGAGFKVLAGPRSCHGGRKFALSKAQVHLGCNGGGEKP